MCGRFTLHTEKELLARTFEVDLSGVDLTASYNVAPSHDILTVRRRDDARIADIMRWGLVPHWVKPLDKLPSLINARIETVASKPAYRDAFRRRRCLVLADGFYEWQSLDKGAPRQPYYVTRRDRTAFAMAAVYERWWPPEDPDAKPLVTCSLVTAPAIAAIQMIHTRMPVILDHERAAAWIDPAHDGRVAELKKVLVPVEGDVLQSYTVSDDVNSPDNDDAHLIDPIENPQPTLF